MNIEIEVKPVTGAFGGPSKIKNEGPELGAPTSHRVRSHFTTENFSDEVEALLLVFLGVTLAPFIRAEIATGRSLFP